MAKLRLMWHILLGRSPEKAIPESMAEVIEFIDHYVKNKGFIQSSKFLDEQYKITLKTEWAELARYLDTLPSLR